MDSNVIIITIVAILLASVAFFLFQQNTNTVSIPGLAKQSNKQPTFIIAGLSNSGKTTLFNSLTIKNGFKMSTVTSQEPNIRTNFKLPLVGNESDIPQLSFKLVECPGHQKLHNFVYDEIKNSSSIRGLIYMIDSTLDPKKMVESAKFLYEILTRTERKANGVDILIACNKSDQFSSRQVKTIKQILETEIDNYRKLSVSNISKSNEDGTDFDDDETKQLSVSLNDQFNFEKLEGHIHISNGSVLKNKIESWTNWIDERVVNP
ncbi:hypothetical protein WICPIJ_005127 [Wickerhamomyces pijperi]|uniref:Signal recognition particle receptor subunit beta n=1 Tax=Wickerhamomyces pijperi TaxID=599730 RepID=A0A9P8Q468_WICPI|nr:hypothetical protein WICPIJ_005127 [Wickerhamomyces pijperi]